MDGIADGSFFSMYIYALCLFMTCQVSLMAFCKTFEDSVIKTICAVQCSAVVLI